MLVSRVLCSGADRVEAISGIGELETQMCKKESEAGSIGTRKSHRFFFFLF